eukprot:m.71504 g.71504  ORF g.71504 m.71504 type:complete len:214 (+) comp50184_c0_seq1:67-708(+)
MTKFAFLGSGKVARAIATVLLREKHEVILAARNPDSDNVKQAVAALPSLQVATIEAGLAAGEIVFLLTPWEGAVAAVQGAGALLDGKIVVDCTNPVAPDFSHALGSARSGTETLQEVAPKALFVKAFSMIGVYNMEDPSFPGYGKALPSNYICGNDAGAKATVSALLTQLGWEVVDCGNASAALHLEHMTLLWIKLAFFQGQGTSFVWSFLRR